MKGILIDCYRLNDEIILWVKSGGKDYRFVDKFVPCIYLRCKNMKQLRGLLLKKKIDSYFTKKYSFSSEELLTICVPIKRISEYEKTVKRIELLTDYSVEIYNADVKIEEYYLFERDLFPLANVEIELVGDGGVRIKSIRALDSSDDLDYVMPEFQISTLKVKTVENLFKSLNTKLEGIRFNNDLIVGTEQEILLKFKEKYLSFNPDIIWAENGNLLLPYLSFKFKQYGIDFKFNRFDEDNDDDIEFKKGDYYFSYSRVVFRSHSIFLKGRLHFDIRSFFADDTGLYGILDGARVCRQRIQKTEMRSAGAAVTNLLLYISHKKNFLLPYKIGILERFKTMYDLYQADRGSMIFEPRVGFHTDLTEFDYVSLYPNIMNKYNLSPESLFCKCCVGSEPVPGLSYYYCKKNKGVVSIVAEKLVKRRIHFKKNKTVENKEKIDYLKWLLVTMFGYQAFKNRKIGTIENHESIQAYARAVIMKSVRVAESFGWEVLHGIIDSIYVKKKGMTLKDVSRLQKEIYNKTGLELAHEGNYRWVVFLPSVLNSKVPVPTRFYGVMADGKLKCRGIEVRRKDSPKIVKNMQLEMIEKLSVAKNEQEFRALFPEVFKILKNYVKTLSFATKEELRIRRTISKTNYVNDIAQSVIVKQMIKEGYDVEPGQSIVYIIRDVENKNPMKRYVTYEGYNGVFDLVKYTELLVKATFSILQPFGFELEGVFEVVKESRQMKLKEFIEEEVVEAISI
jgi:DNA polymerase elongation subunit (family B)